MKYYVCSRSWTIAFPFEVFDHANGAAVEVAGIGVEEEAFGAS
jgi:hypothetical protein